MTINDKIEQLENLKCHCSDMARGEALSNEWMKDIEALDFAIATIKQEQKTDVLDKIKAEIAEEKIEHDLDIGNETLYNNAIDDCLKIIDKYRQEG